MPNLIALHNRGSVRREQGGTHCAGPRIRANGRESPRLRHGMPKVNNGIADLAINEAYH